MKFLVLLFVLSTIALASAVTTYTNWATPGIGFGSGVQKSTGYVIPYKTVGWGSGVGSHGVGGKGLGGLGYGGLGHGLGYGGLGKGYGGIGHGLGYGGLGHGIGYGGLGKGYGGIGHGLGYGGHGLGYGGHGLGGLGHGLGGGAGVKALGAVAAHPGVPKGLGGLPFVGGHLG